jgi:hypothetical protein
VQKEMQINTKERREGDEETKGIKERGHGMKI